MRTLMTLVVVLAVLGMGSVAVAQEAVDGVNTEGLTEKQKAELALKAAEMKEAAKNADTRPAPEKVKEWAELTQEFGEGLGNAIAGTARALNVEVNEFIKTPAGKMTVVILAWKLMGAEIVHYIAGTLFFIVAMSIWWYLLRRMVVMESVTYTPVEGKALRKKEIEYQTGWDNDRVNAAWAFAAFGLVIILIANLIFWAG